jgi:urease accessory protein
MKPLPPLVRQGLSACTLLLSTPAVASPADAAVAGTPWLDGAAHPFLEASHSGSLLILGIAAALLGRRSTWGLPVMIALLMGFGIVLGTQGAVTPMLDTIVLTTGFCLMLLILGKVHLVFATVASVAGAFALFHGVSDGIGMVQTHVHAGYLGGYGAATLLLLAIGVGIGEWIHHYQYNTWAEHIRHWYHSIHDMRIG